MCPKAFEATLQSLHRLALRNKVLTDDRGSVRAIGVQIEGLWGVRGLLDASRALREAYHRGEFKEAEGFHPIQIDQVWDGIGIWRWFSGAS